MLALVSLLAVACKDKKEDKKEEPTTQPTSTEPTTTTDPAPNSTNADGVPSFSDPEVQKFANDYAAFIKEYKNGMKDPTKLSALAQKMQEWSKKATEMGAKLVNSPEEAKKWTDWAMAIAKEFMPQ